MPKDQTEASDSVVIDQPLVTSLPVCWRMGETNEIHWSNAVRVDDNRVIFDDDGWNPRESCFFSEEQCRLFHGLPSQEWQDTRADVADKLHKMADELSS